MKNRLSKYLDERLTPDERLALMTRAHLRGDLAEKERLAREAPTHSWRIAETHPLGEAWLAVAQIEFMEAMKTVLMIRQTEIAVLSDRTPEPLRHKAAESIGVLLYLLLLRARAWRRLGKQNGIDALAFWHELPGWDDVRKELAFARKVAPKRATVEVLILAATPGTDTSRIQTMRFHLARLKREFQSLLVKWKTVADGPPVSNAFCS